MKICLVSTGLEERNLPLQPWNYLFNTAESLFQSSCNISIISDGYPHLPKQGYIKDFPVIRLSRLNDFIVGSSHHTLRAIDSIKPNIILWHLGLSNFLTLRRIPQISNAPVIGIFTRPAYTFRDFTRLGIRKLAMNSSLSVNLFLGMYYSARFIRWALQERCMKKVVVECETTQSMLVSQGVPRDSIHVIKPEIASEWAQFDFSDSLRSKIRRSLHLKSNDYVIGFFGSPQPLRGLDTLIKSIPLALKENSAIKLLILSRQREGVLQKEYKKIERLIHKLDGEKWVRLVKGFLPRHQLIRKVASCDLIALPFEIVPSDVPLSVLETVAIKVPLLTTRVACLPELVPEHAGLIVKPGKAEILASAILDMAHKHRELGDQPRVGENDPSEDSRDGMSRPPWIKLIESVRNI